MRSEKATVRHEEFRQTVLTAMKPFDDIPPIEQLAVLASTIGQLIALQDARKYSATAVTRMVVENMERGNALAVTAVAMGVIRPGQ